MVQVVNCTLHLPFQLLLANVSSLMSLLACDWTSILKRLVCCAVQGKWVIVEDLPCNEFFSGFSNCLTYKTPEEFSAHLKHALVHDPKPVRLFPLRCHLVGCLLESLLTTPSCLACRQCFLFHSSESSGAVGSHSEAVDCSQRNQEAERSRRCLHW